MNEQLAKQAADKLSDEEYDALATKEWESGRVNGTRIAIIKAKDLIAKRVGDLYMEGEDRIASLFRELAKEIDKLK